MGLKKDQKHSRGIELQGHTDRLVLVKIPKKGKKRLRHHEVVHDLDGLMWCGLATISALTGEPTSVARDLIKKARKNPATKVTGTTVYELEFAFKRLGYSMEQAYMYAGNTADALPTFRKWLRETKGERPENVGYLILFEEDSENPERHWGVILHDRYICSNTEKWVSLRRAPFKDRPISEAYVVRKVEG